MFLKKLNLDNKILKDAKSSFNINYIENKSDESIVARYIIQKELKKQGINNYLPQVDNEGIPVFFDDNYWSISHKKGLVFVGVSKNNIGIDIEIYKERDISLLDQFDIEEYDILGGKNWANFYVLWTAKESVIKNNLGKLDDMKNIKLLKYQSKNNTINYIKFTNLLEFSFNGINFKVLSGVKDNLIYGVCI